MGSLDIILFAMVAGFIILRLRSELGNKTGEEPQPPSINDQFPSKDGRHSDKKVINGEYETSTDNVIPMEVNPELRDAFRKIHLADRNFTIDNFLHGAKTVYQMVLESFWNGDRETLKTYLSDDIYNQFEGAITAREAAGHILKNQFLDIVDVNIVEAALKNKVAEIAVHFKAEIIAVTRDKDGNAIDGNLSDVTVLKDKWTFTHDTASKDPSWLLVATHSE